MDRNKDRGVANYVAKVVSDAFLAIGRPDDSEYVLYSVDSLHYALVIRSGMQAAMKRVAYRCSRNFRKNFGCGITVFSGRKARTLFGDVQDCAVVVHVDGPDMLDIDPNHDIFYDRETPLGDITVGIVPNSNGVFAGKRYPGSESGRVLYRDIMAQRGDEEPCYRGRKGWDEYVRDFASVCDGLEPGYAIPVERITTHWHAVKGASRT